MPFTGLFKYKAGKDVAFSESAGNIVYHIGLQQAYLINGVECKTKLLALMHPFLILSPEPQRIEYSIRKLAGNKA
jgi:hypothetical protein